MRITFPRVLFLLCGLMMLAYSFVLAPRWSGVSVAASDPAPTAVPTWLTKAKTQPTPATPPVFPASGTTFTGIMTKQGSYDLAPLDAFTKAVKHQPQVLEFSVGWWDPKFHRAPFDAVAERGMMPVVAWEPWDYHKESSVDTERGNQPEYSLQNIIDGKFDAYIKNWAEGVKALGYPIGLRFAHEMNGYWYPWAEQANGNRPGQYVTMWRHVYDLFQQVGATNVTWIWSPNIDYTNATPLKSLYPGDAYVDWVGLSGYYGTVGKKKYQTFNQIFQPSMRELRKFTQKPVVITETAATDVSGLKARWITQMFQELPNDRDIIGVIWFESIKEVDWRVAASAEASAAYAKGVAQSRFRTTWTIRSTPLKSLPAPTPPPKHS